MELGAGQTESAHRERPFRPAGQRGHGRQDYEQAPGPEKPPGVTNRGPGQPGEESGHEFPERVSRAVC